MAATQKINFLTWFPICSFRQFLAKTYRFTTIQNVTDRQTDRQTTDRRHSVPKAQPDSTVGQKLVSADADGSARRCLTPNRPPRCTQLDAECSQQATVDVDSIDHVHCQQHADDGGLFIALGDGKRAVLG